LDKDMAALDKYFVRVEKMLTEGESPEKITQQIRDDLLFYTAHQIRITNGNVRENKKEIRFHRWLITVALLLAAWQLGMPLIPFP